MLCIFAASCDVSGSLRYEAALIFTPALACRWLAARATCNAILVGAHGEWPIAELRHVMTALSNLSGLLRMVRIDDVDEAEAETACIGAKLASSNIRRLAFQGDPCTFPPTLLELELQHCFYEEGIDNALTSLQPLPALQYLYICSFGFMDKQRAQLLARRLPALQRLHIELPLGWAGCSSAPQGISSLKCLAESMPDVELAVTVNASAPKLRRLAHNRTSGSQP